MLIDCTDASTVLLTSAQCYAIELCNPSISVPLSLSHTHIHLDHITPVFPEPNPSQRRLTQQGLLEDRQRAALRLLPDGGALGDEACEMVNRHDDEARVYASSTHW